MIYSDIKRFFKNVWNGMLGICGETLLVYFFIFVGFLVCMLWWSVHK